MSSHFDEGRALIAVMVQIPSADNKFSVLGSAAIMAGKSDQ